MKPAAQRSWCSSPFAPLRLFRCLGTRPQEETLSRGWMGFELLPRSFQIGISTRRAEWFATCTRDIASADHVHMGNFEEGSGHVLFVVGALAFERPFLGPFLPVHVHPPSELRELCPFVCLVYPHVFTQQIHLSRQSSCSTELRSMESGPRVDAQASMSRTDIGGWLPRRPFTPSGDWGSPPVFGDPSPECWGQGSKLEPLRVHQSDAPLHMFRVVRTLGPLMWRH